VKILVADHLSELGVATLAERYGVDVKTGLTKEQLLEVIPDYDAVIVRSATTVDAEVIAAAGKLKVIGRAGIGLDNVDVDAATRAGIVVCNAPQSNVISAAEHTVAMMLALVRRIPQADAALRRGKWERARWSGAELHGKTLGILGLGRIGVLVAQRCNAFGMRLVAYDPYIAPDRAARMGVRLLSDLDDVLRVADVVTIHLPKTPETIWLVDAERLALMKPAAYIVNVARGGIVDEDALVEALRSGSIAGAALDVFSTEPLTESPLFDLENVVVTPHLGASTREAQDKAGVQIAEAVDLALRGEFVTSAVNVQGGEVDEGIRPFLPLADRLGRLLTGLVEGGFGSEVTISYVGDIAGADCRLLGLAVLRGILSGVVHEPVTPVNAPLLAQERGIRVREVSEPRSEEFVSLLRVSTVDREGREMRVAGTVIQPAGRERLVEVWDVPVDVEPARHMAFFRYEDRPGIIGKVGTILGAEDVNIANMQVGRREAGGEAIMVLCLDQPVDPPTLDRITADIGAYEARAISLDGT
jgi:D-3-phosphoglycerate dehydrogenase / 2-oxoglutarate reductase